LDVLVGYLIFDAWIGNTDRHHENWGITLERQGEHGYRFRLAPTFDHASSLGCHLTDQERSARLTTRDAGFSIEKYAPKARSAFYEKLGDTKPLSTSNVARLCFGIRPGSARYWLEQVRAVLVDRIGRIMDEIPEVRISQPAKRFATRMLSVNQELLLRASESVA
jgi:hypothetical protein